MVSRKGTSPNFQTVLTIPDLIRWLADLEGGRWSWAKNSQCKYVSIGIDTRSGCYSVKDRDGNPLTPEQLMYQVGLATPIALPQGEI